MNDGKVVIKFTQCSEQSIGKIKRVTGFVKLGGLIDLIDLLDLEANPRESQKGAVTDAITESIERTPEIFPFKTKGLLLGSSRYRALERQRYEVYFHDFGIEGILDGGHNLLAIGLFLLEKAGASTSELRKVKKWSDFREAWNENSLLIIKLREEQAGTSMVDGNPLALLVPVEMLLPVDPDDPIAIDEFKSHLLDICVARNNNVQLSVGTKANQRGYFIDLKNKIDTAGYAKNTIEWKTNDGGLIKVADVICLAWIPLTVVMEAHLPKYQDERGKVIDTPAPQKIYSGAGDCLNRFERLMSSPEVTITTDDPRRELKNDSILSAFKITADLLEIYDYIYEQLPDLYNCNGGRYRGITAVKALNPANRRKEPEAKYSGKAIDTASPAGFVMPLVYGIQSLLVVDEEGIIRWKTDPMQFLQDHLQAIVKQFTLMFAPYNWDPQKIGKAQESYTQALNAYETEYLRFVSMS